MLQKYHQVNHSVNFNACLLWFWYIHLVHLHVHSTAYRVCMTSYIISTNIQHQPTNLYCMGINNLGMHGAKAKQMLRVYKLQLQIGAKYIFHLRDNTRLSSTWQHPQMMFLNQRWSLITRCPTCLPLYLNPLQDICMNTKMWAQIPDHGSMTFTVVHAYRKFIAKKNKWMGQCTHTLKGVISYNGGLRKLY